MVKQIVTVITFLFVSLALPATAQFTVWSSPIKLGSPINTPFQDSCVSISKNGLALFFSSNRQTENPVSPDRDLYVSTRESLNADWGTPVPLTTLNMVGVWDSCPQLSLDEHRLYFTSTRAGGCGGEDFWVSRRHDRKDNTGWEAPEHLACEAQGGVNTAGRDLTPALFEDESGKVIMYFSKVQPGTPYWGIFQSEMRDDDTFGPGTPVAELNSTTYSSAYAAVRRDGREVIFASNRPGGSAVAGSMDFWTATRASTSDPWSNPVFNSEFGNPAWAGGHFSFSFDGREFYFNSWAPGGYTVPGGDIYVVRREKLR